MKKLILPAILFYSILTLNAQSNTFQGANSGLNNITSDNSGFGQNTLKFATNGGFNSAFGSNSLGMNTTGGFNCSFGSRSSESLITGENNIAMGFISLSYLTKGNFNVALGSNALRFLSDDISITSNNNTAVGTNSGNRLSYGSNNLFLGYAANKPDGSWSNQLVIETLGDYDFPLITGDFGLNYVKLNGFTEIKNNSTIVGAPQSGLRLTSLPNTSASITNPTNKILSVNAIGDIILVDDKQGVGGVTTNTLGSTTNTMTNNVNGVVATAQIVNTVANTIASGALITTVNGVASTAVVLPTQSLSITGSQLTISNGNTITLPAAGAITNLYNTSASITPANFGDRVVSLNNNNLVFNTTGTNTARNKVYIGNTPSYPTTTGNYKLYVEGGILTEKVKVALRSTANWADSVFASDYKLTPLNEVEQFVKTNKHLHGITSAENLVKEGLDLAEMQAKQMAKIEELTLYAIEQNKKLEKQNKEIEDLKVLVNALINKNK